MSERSERTIITAALAPMSGPSVTPTVGLRAVRTGYGPAMSISNDDISTSSDPDEPDGGDTDGTDGGDTDGTDGGDTDGTDGGDTDGTDGGDTDGTDS